jgi:hypothetical protein
MIKLTVLVKRNATLSVEEFHERWRRHGELIAATPDLARHIARYEQHHRTAADHRNPLVPHDYDGLALQWFESFDEFLAMLGEPAYKEILEPDEDALLDKAGLVVMFTDEPEVVLP